MNKLLERFKEYISASQFNAIRLGLSSPEKIKTLSYGEVKKIETINYRTLKPEKDGLFCARIFGPVKDWECNCGKYKRMKHRGVTCEKCGVEVIQSRVRRERMAHIDLVSPVCHIWYLKGIPSYLSLIMSMPVKELERVIYFDAYLVIRQGNSPFPQKTLLTAVEYQQYKETHEDDDEFRAEIGAEAVRVILSMMDLSTDIAHLKEAYAKSSSIAARHKIMRRVKVLSGLNQANLKPEWIVLTVLPVLPPDLRPLVPLEGGRFASSDLNELYRRVLNRNIRLRRLMDIDAPDVIIKNEKRMLQESVDGLIDNGRRGQPVRGSNKRPLKSLSEMLRGKQGRFRQNLLGKRVDYSGRSVIVVDPELHMNQCGLPKIMALELFKSYVYSELLRCELAPNLRAAKKMVEQGTPEVWDALEEVVRPRIVLLNRAPTLHRLGIQAFYPILVDGKAIKIHPLVCTAFNADFDGDQMAVHLPLSKRAQLECKRLVLSTKNLISAANGRPITVPSQDMVLGLYYITKIRLNVKGEGTVFADTQEVISAYQNEQVNLHAKIKVRIDKKIIDTTVGRVLLFDALPAGSPFVWVNRLMTKGDLAKLVENVYYAFGDAQTAPFLDRIKRLGFRNSTMGGISISLSDLVVPANKEQILDKAKKNVAKIEKMYMDGAITNGERYNKVISVWSSATSEVANEMSRELEHQDEIAFTNADKKDKPFNPVFMMLESGAKGSKDQIKQLSGMRGLMAKPSGEIMETPVTSSFKGGLSVFEYFISTHGARKGQADTALKTANSGYLTRRLVDVAQDVVVTQHDCHTLGYIEIKDLKEAGDVILPLSKRVYGRILAADLHDPITGELILKQGHMIGREDIDKIAQSAANKIKVRSVMTCQTKRGVCTQCYGMDLSKGELVYIGTTVGIIAAQSIGEPGTQLTMRTFHIGGTASVLREQSSFVSKHDGVIEWRGIHAVKNQEGQSIISSRKASLVVLSDDGRELQEHTVEYGSGILVTNGEKVITGKKLVEWDPNSKMIFTEKAGTAHYVDLVENVTLQEKYDESTKLTSKMVLEPRGESYQPAISVTDDKGDEIAHYYLPAGCYLNIENGQKVAVGDVLVKIPREISKTKDITTGGLPRIAELFEARTPKDAAIISDIDGEVVFGGIVRGMLKISVVSSYESFDYLVPRGAQLNVANGDHVSAGDLLTTGSPVLHDILRIKGQDVLHRYLVDQIQEIYRLQGVNIDDRHIEVISRQMLRKVRIVDSGDTDFLIGDRVDRIHFQEVNSALAAEGKKIANGKPILMGITMASLGTESFFAAASFQETTRILAEAAISGAVDNLYGLKENIIIGKLIPAGTGIKSFRDRYLGDDVPDLERRARLLEHEQQAQAQAAKMEAPPTA